MYLGLFERVITKQRRQMKKEGKENAWTIDVATGQEMRRSQPSLVASFSCPPHYNNASESYLYYQNV